METRTMIFGVFIAAAIAFAIIGQEAAARRWILMEIVERVVVNRFPGNEVSTVMEHADGLWSPIL